MFNCFSIVVFSLVFSSFSIAAESTNRAKEFCIKGLEEAALRVAFEEVGSFSNKGLIVEDSVEVATGLVVSVRGFYKPGYEIGNTMAEAELHQFAFNAYRVQEILFELKNADFNKCEVESIKPRRFLPAMQ